jgi:hypothetical protein
MRKVSSAPSLRGISPVSTPIIKSTSNTSLNALNTDVGIEIASHAPINSISKCVMTYGFPDEIVKKEDKMKDFIACVMTPDDEERRELSCPVQDERFERAAAIIRRQKKNKK